MPSRSTSARSARVTLTRDPFGIKPLYIAQVEDGLAFASEPQALLEAGLVKRAVRPAAREELLQLQFTTGADTIFEGIQRVLPGETLTCADGHILDRRRISPIPEGGPENIDEDAALARLDRALEESVDLHQRSDVPYGMFLSGGIDSATLITLMARLNSEPVLAFTAGFDAPGAADEREHAAAVAQGAGRAARVDRDHRGDGLAASARDRRLHGRSGGRLRDHPDLVPGPARAAGREGGADAARAATRFSPVTTAIARRCGRGGGAGGRCGRAAVSTRCTVLRARPAGWRDGMAAAEAARGGGRAVAAGGGAGDRHDRLAAARPAAEAGPLPDGACGGGAHAVPRSRAWRRRRSGCRTR